MEMNQVRYFLALAKERNFTRAAETCGVTQPALTRAIQTLEAEFGGPLFHRERARTHLSELGRMMAPYLETIAAQAEAVRKQALSAKRLEHLELKLGAMSTLSPMVLADFMATFQTRHDSLRFRVHDGHVADVLEKLAAGDLEIGVVAHPDPLDEKFHVMPIFKERFVVVLPPNHPLTEKNAVPVRDLDDLPYVNRVHCEYYDASGKAFGAQGVRVRKVFRSERDDWVLAMVRAGLGWAFFPEFSLIPRDVVVRPLIEPEFSRTVTLVTVRGRPHSPAVGAFVRAARAHTWPAAAELARAL